MLLKKSISYFKNIMYKRIMYKRIFLNFGVISFINKEMVSYFQLHTYKFGLVYKGENGVSAFIGCLCTYLRTSQTILMTILAGSQVSDRCPLGFLSSNISESVWSIKADFYGESSWEGWT